MTAQSPFQLPGNGFSVWTQNPPPSCSIKLIGHSALGSAPAASACCGGGHGHAPSKTGKAVTFSSEPAPRVIIKKRSPFLQWVAMLLFGCALLAFISTEAKRKELEEEKHKVEADNVVLSNERQQFFDNWKGEESTNAELTQNIAGLEADLQQSKATVMGLTAEKNGLNETIKQLRGSLEMAIQDHKKTEESLGKVIAELEKKNSEITASLAAESEKLKGVEARLESVMKELAAAQEQNKQITAENAELKAKVQELQVNLQKTMDDAQAKESSLREEIGKLHETNQSLQKSLEDQKKELDDVRAQLKVSEEKAEKSSAETNQASAKIDDLSTQLFQVTQIRDQLAADKEALAKSVANMEVELDQAIKAQQTAEITDSQAGLLERNAALEKMVSQLNEELSKASTSGTTQETELTQRIEVLSASNAALQESLERQRIEFNDLLRQARESSGPRTEELEGAIGTLKHTLSQSIQQGRSAETLESRLADRTAALLDLNTRLAIADEELRQARSVLGEVGDLKEELAGLRKQGQALQSELLHRTQRISTLQEDNDSWKKEAAALKELVDAEHLAQETLKSFVGDLQSKIASLQQSQEASGTVALSEQ